MSGSRISRRRFGAGLVLQAGAFAVPSSLFWSSAARAELSTLALAAGSGTGGDGVPAREAKLTAPFGVDFDRAGNIWMVELTGGRVLKIEPSGKLRVLGGDGSKAFAGDGGPLSGAKFNGMHSLAIRRDGTVYLADTWNNRVRQVNPRTGVITTLAGTGEKGYGGDDGPAVKAQFGGIYCVALDPAGEQLYLADLDNRRIRRIDLKSGTVSTVAGNGEKGVPADGAVAKEAPLVDPRAVAAGPNGEFYVLERGGHALRVVDRGGKIRTVVGTGLKGASGDGGSAREATLNGPKHLCVDRDGSVIIADTENHLIRRYLPKEGKIVRVAGCGRKGIAGLGGPPELAELNQPHGVCVDPHGLLYIVDSSNDRVLMIGKRS